MEDPEAQGDHELDKLVRCNSCDGRGEYLTVGRIGSAYVECILGHGTGRIPLRLYLLEQRWQEGQDRRRSK
jgi:hypothetical protein